MTVRKDSGRWNTFPTGTGTVDSEDYLVGWAMCGKPQSGWPPLGTGTWRAPQAGGRSRSFPYRSGSGSGILCDRTFRVVSRTTTRQAPRGPGGPARRAGARTHPRDRVPHNRPALGRTGRRVPEPVPHDGGVGEPLGAASATSPTCGRNNSCTVVVTTKGASHACWSGDRPRNRSVGRTVGWSLVARRVGRARCTRPRQPHRLHRRRPAPPGQRRPTPRAAHRPCPWQSHRRRPHAGRPARHPVTRPESEEATHRADPRRLVRRRRSSRQ
jgi:hypothetical protein